MAMVPHERSLVNRMHGRSFALLGVNLDRSRDELQQVQDRNKITWRSWYDGFRGGPITDLWHVHALPSIFVIDAKGVLRYEGVYGKDLDRAVETLLKEMESGG
jgi:hypothetical protein